MCACVCTCVCVLVCVCFYQHPRASPLRLFKQVNAKADKLAINMLLSPPSPLLLPWPPPRLLLPPTSHDVSLQPIHPRHGMPL